MSSNLVDRHWFGLPSRTIWVRKYEIILDFNDARNDGVAMVSA